MADDRQKLILGERKGVPFYGANPSMPSPSDLTTRTRPKRIANGRDAMIVHPSTSEILGRSSVVFMASEDVDSNRFVKLYVDGVKGITGLKAAGVRVLELVIKQLHEKQDQDQVMLSSFLAREAGIEERTYQRGLRDLQDREVLFASHIEGLFYINIQFMFNGNRLHFVRSYHLREAKQTIQPELGFDGKLL